MQGGLEGPFVREHRAGDLPLPYSATKGNLGSERLQGFKELLQLCLSLSWCFRGMQAGGRERGRKEISHFVF